MTSCCQIVVLFLAVSGAVNGVRRLRGNSREGKNLLGTFPFNQQDSKVSGDHEYSPDHDAVHEEYPERLPAASALESHASRQTVFTGQTAPKFGEVAEKGVKCINKVELAEETEYDDVVKCEHSYDKRCHTTYKTNYVSQQEEHCEENFKKSCFISYEQVAFNETVQVCRKPLVKDCETKGPEVCTTEYESECWTKQEVHEVVDDIVNCRTEVVNKCDDETSGYTTSTKCSKWPKEVCTVEKKPVKKYTPITGCTKEPREICAPSGCGFKEGKEECYEKAQTVVQDAPNEECNLEPKRACKHVTKLVPKLEPIEECVDVPKEVCNRSRTNPRKVKKPVVRKWCYTPTEESGLA